MVWVALLLLALFSSVASHYKVSADSSNSSSVVLQLEYTGDNTYYGKPSSPILKNLLFALNCHTASDISFKITDPNRTRFEIPQTGIFPKDPVGDQRFDLKDSMFNVTFTNDPFTFKIVRKEDGQVLFDTTGTELIYSEYYLQLSTVVPTQYLYGLGERFSNRFRISPGKYTIFNRDRPFKIDRREGLQTYGHYPIYFLRESKGNFHINYLRNSNAMDVMVANSSSDKYLLTYKIIGGVFDFRLFVGSKDAGRVIERLHEYQGNAMIPPFWSLGFHQCRWGYRDVGYLENVLRSYENNDIPLDTIWTDIDYMYQYEDFTVDEGKFPLNRMSAITDSYHYIPIIDAGIKTSGNAYQQGLERNVFIKNLNGTVYIGKVWPGTTAFVDFFHPNASAYWSNMLDKLYQKIKFGGIWLDMNELANFCEGNCFQDSPNKVFDYRRDIPYHPGSDNIESNAISLNATHTGNISEANAHAFYGFMESEATYKYLKSKGIRPFIISRSSTIGSNKYAGHWTGDNFANFEFLKSGISNNFLFQIWGTQMVGDDICGFGGNTNQELCARWFQFGSFSPFTRDHNIFEGISQQPYALGPKVLASAKTNLRLRYSLLKFYYRHFIIRKGLGVIYKPLFIDFPTDEEVFVDEIIETEFIIGQELLVTPILVERTTTRTVYFPKDSNWYDFFSGKRYQGKNVAQITNSMTDAVPMFIREGTGVVVQDVSKIRKTKEMNNVFTIKAGLAKSDSGTYCATVGLLSIIDFNNDTQIDQCLVDGCDYNISLEVTMTKDAKSISMSVDYLGGTGLNQEQVINSLMLFHETEGTITVNLTEPIKIQGKLALTVKQFNDGKQVFTVSDQQEKPEEVQQPSQDHLNTQDEGGSSQDDSSATDNTTTTTTQGQSTTSQTPELQGITKEELEILQREQLEADIAEKAEKEKLRAEQEEKDKLEKEKAQYEQEKLRKAALLKAEDEAKQKAKLKAKQDAEKLEAEMKLREQAKKAEIAENERLRKEEEKAKQQKEIAQRAQEEAEKKKKQQEEREKIKSEMEQAAKQQAAKEQAEREKAATEKANRDKQEKDKTEKLRAQKEKADQAILNLKKEKTDQESQNTEIEETPSETQQIDDSIQQSEQTFDEGEQQSSSEIPSGQKPQATGEESTVEETSESDDQQPGQVSEPDSENSRTQEGTWISSTYNKAKEFYEEQRMGLLIGGGVFLLLIILWVGIRVCRRWLYQRHNPSRIHVQDTETKESKTGQSIVAFEDEQS